MINITAEQRQQLQALLSQATIERERRYLSLLLTQGVDRRVTFCPSADLLQRVNAILQRPKPSGG